MPGAAASRYGEFVALGRLARGTRRLVMARAVGEGRRDTDAIRACSFNEASSGRGVLVLPGYSNATEAGSGQAISWGYDGIAEGGQWAVGSGHSGLRRAGSWAKNGGSFDRWGSGVVVIRT